MRIHYLFFEIQQAVVANLVVIEFSKQWLLILVFIEFSRRWLLKLVVV